MSTFSASITKWPALRRVARNRFVMFRTFVLVGGLGILIVWSLVKPTYEVVGAIRVAPTILNILTGEPDRVSDYQSFMYTQAKMVTSDRVVQRVADDLIGKDLAWLKDRRAGGSVGSEQGADDTTRQTHGGPDATASILKQAISDGVIKAAAVPKTELIKVTMKDRNAEEAEQIVNSFIRNYMAVEASGTAQSEGQKLAVLENERHVLAEKLRYGREKMHELSQEFGSAGLDSGQEMRQQRARSLLAELTRVEVRRLGLEAHVSSLEQAGLEAVEPARQQVQAMRRNYIDRDALVQTLARRMAKMETDVVIAEVDQSVDQGALKHQADVLAALKSRLDNRKEELGESFDEMTAREHTMEYKRNLSKAKAALDEAKTYENRLREILAEDETQGRELSRRQQDMQDLHVQTDLDQERYETVCRRIQELEIERKRPARVSAAYNADIVSAQDPRIGLTVAVVLCALIVSVIVGVARGEASPPARVPAASKTKKVKKSSKKR